MRFSYAESMVDPTFYLPLARAAEEAGYDGMVIPDSICYPQESDSTYPFSPDHSRSSSRTSPSSSRSPSFRHSGGHRASPVHHLRAQAPDPVTRCWWPSRPHQWRS